MEIKRCPACGGKAELVDVTFDTEGDFGEGTEVRRYRFFVQCTKCKAKGGTVGHDVAQGKYIALANDVVNERTERAREVAIEFWNSGKIERRKQNEKNKTCKI